MGDAQKFLSNLKRWCELQILFLEQPRLGTSVTLCEGLRRVVCTESARPQPAGCLLDDQYY
jgi:hypothetical protein